MKQIISGLTSRNQSPPPFIFFLITNSSSSLPSTGFLSDEYVLVFLSMFLLSFPKLSAPNGFCCCYIITTSSVIPPTFSSSRCRLLILPPSSSSVDTINELLDDTKKHSQIKRVEGGCGSTCIQTGNVWPFVGLGRRVKETNQAGCTREINYFIMPRAPLFCNMPRYNYCYCVLDGIRAERSNLLVTLKKTNKKETANIVFSKKEACGI